MFMVTPRSNAAALRPPIPANAIWPSESCPPQPVSTVTDTAQIAKARMTEYVKWRADWCTRSGSAIAAISAMPATTCGMRRTHQISRSRSGTGGTRGANAKLSPPPSSARLIRATSRSTRMKSTNCTRLLLSVKLNVRI